MKHHILFITTSNLATNPRTYKEIQLALKNGKKVTLLCFSFDNWSKDINDKIKSGLENKIQYIEIPGNRKPFFPWLLSTVVYALADLVLRIFPANPRWLSFRSNKRSWLIMREVQRLSIKPDWVVAHNIGSFFPALVLAKKTSARLGIDLEDYHPGESNTPVVVKRTERLLRYILPRAQYITAASPLILEASLSLTQSDATKEVIMNYFPEKEFTEPAVIEHEALQIVWFSQNISFNRGLEQVLPVINETTGVELHLFGHCNPDFFRQHLQSHQHVFIHEALPQAQLHQKLSGFDIGLALEPGKDRNNELAVSNKMLAYYQAGLYILASHTPAQSAFLTTHPASGMLTDLDRECFKEALLNCIADLHAIRSERHTRFQRARNTGWDTEGKRLLALWEQV